MSRVNVDKNLDPDFGRIVPSVESAFWVSVIGRTKQDPTFRFVLMMPLVSMEDAEYEDFIVMAVSQMVGSLNCETKVRPFDHDTFHKLSKSTYMACFHPDDPENFIWLNPPMYAKH